MHAFLITGANSEKRSEQTRIYLSKWQISPIDAFTIIKEESAITITQIRQLQKRLQLKPYQSRYTVGIISDTEYLTIEAQQALLKTLEEPPPLAKLILETSNINSLLPTIISRCQVISLAGEPAFDQKSLDAIASDLKKLLTSPIGHKLLIIDVLATNKTECLNWIDKAISVCRNSLLSNYGLNKNFPAKVVFKSVKLVRLIQALSKGKTQLNVNVNPKLVMDQIFLPSFAKNLDRKIEE